jgi:hypothetical protein
MCIRQSLFQFIDIRGLQRAVINSVKHMILYVKDNNLL